ncbi:MAG: glycerol-3-phosphate 1-O-acyltransferase PlsB [Gammaproteobacteria bacterium]|nr:glycerol-3-phosphate 1-O-acyltransferase PlsB [Gammaproteobacteria bacterium]MBV8403895.1 glycerol-3-phosphate 1-O-acyltransferase PlsB [Gammaproteobacteria bacterium]
MSWLLRKVLALWVRVRVLPEDAAAQLRGRPRPLCYVLERRSATDLAVLQEWCARLRLPRPGRPLGGGTHELRSYLWLTRTRGLCGRRLDRRPPRQLAQMIAALRADPQADFELVPAAVYWGRAPHKEASWLRLLVSDDFAVVSRARRFLQVVLNGRDTLLELDEPLSLRTLLGAELGGAAPGRRVARTLRALYARRRAARIGPDLSHRRTIVNRVLRTRAVRAAVAQEMRERHLSRHKALQRARAYAWEIAANYSHAFVRLMEHALGWLWNRLYDGVVFGHAETLAAVAEGNEIIYVPCHRSHMDYLLLAYVIYVHGYAVPHTAAGVNLNLPLVGRLLRKGGAFFIRRSFGGNRLYTAVFMKYLAAIMGRGHAIEYFIEGSRSRTGRLLQPKTGMLLMTARSFLADPARPVIFVPVYFGYERLVEGATFVGELSGRPKQKESVRGLLGSWRVLRQRFGKVYVNLGEPIALSEILDRHDAAWRTRRFDDDTRLPWLAAAVDELAERIMRHINSAAAVTPVNLLALALLAMPRLALPEADLVRQLELYRSLLGSFPYSNRITVTALSGSEMLAYGESLRLIEREPHQLGDIVHMTVENAVLATYFRNNVLHLVALPSLVACVFVGNPRVSTADIQRLAWRVYPYIAAELFLHWSEAELPAVVEATLACLTGHGLIEPEPEIDGWRRPPPASAEAMHLSLLAQATLQIIERYYMVVAQLLLAGSGELTQAALEELCQQAAQRMTLLYGLNSPEFFDRATFANFIGLLRARGVVHPGPGGRLEFGEVLARVAQDARFVLSEQLRHSILQIMHA